MIRIRRYISFWASGSVRKVYLNEFYHLGSSLALFISTDWKDKKKISDAMLAAFFVKDNLKNLVATYPSITTSKFLIARFNFLFEDMDNNLFLLAGEKNDKERIKSLIEEGLKGLIEIAKKIDEALAEQLIDLDAYHITQKGIYDTRALMERAEKVFPESILDKLDDVTINEVRESGRCFVFDCFTACGFHMLRSVERTMRKYFSILYPEFNQESLKGWGDYIRELRKIKDDDVKKVAELLDRIRDSDRNPLMHPEVMLSEDDAYVLFDLGKSAIMAMASRLENLRPLVH